MNTLKKMDIDSMRTILWLSTVLLSLNIALYIKQGTMNYNLRIILFVNLIAGFVCFSSCENKQNRHDDIVTVPSEDTTITVKVSYPEKWKKNDKIIVWSMSPLTDAFIPDTIANRNLWMGPVLRTALLDSGYVNIEYLERNDSIEYLGRKYRTSDSNTKARDLENLLIYIKSIRQLKNKKIILIGLSEGGDINCKVASRRSSDIYAMLQLACNALSKEEFVNYHKEWAIKQLIFPLESGDPKFIGEGQKYMDSTFNKMSSLDNYYTADYNGIKQFFEEKTQPVADLISQYESMDSIFFRAELYLRNQWDKEDEETKSLSIYNNNFENYYNFFIQTFISLTPHQITIRKWNPEEYYPFINCPVMAVQGTYDERIDCYPNIERMERLLKKGGNSNFEKIILDGYDHSLVKGNEAMNYVITSRAPRELSIDDSIIENIIAWIDKQ